MKKIAVLIGCVLGLPAYADVNLDITGIDESGVCNNETSTCIVDGSDNTLTVGSDLYKTIVAGNATNTDDKLISVINNTVIINGNIDKSNVSIYGSKVSVENGNNDVEAEGTIKVIDNTVAHANLYGASVNVEKRFDDNITSDQNINLEGSVLFGNSNIYRNIVVGSNLSYEDSNGAGNVSVTQKGLVDVNYTQLYETEITGANIHFNTIDIAPNLYSSGSNSKIFNLGGVVNIRGSHVDNDNDINGTLISGSYANHDHTEINANGTVNVLDFGEIVHFNVNGTTVNLSSVTPESDGSDITINATGNINIDSSLHFAGDIAGVNEITNDVNVVRNYQGNFTVVGEATASIGTNTNIYGVKINDTNLRNFDYISNNTFSAISTSSFSTDSLNNFGNYSFTINEENYDYLADIDNRSAVKVGDFIGNDAYTNEAGDLVKTVSTISVTGISGDIDTDVVNGTFFNLITLNDDAVAGYKIAENGDITTEETALDKLFNLASENTKVGVGLVREAGITYDVVDDGKTIRATIVDVIVDDEKVDYVLKGLGEGHVAALNNVLRGTDNLTSVLSDKHKKAGMFTPIAVINGGKNKYKDSVHVNSTDYRFMVGSRYQFTDNLFAGIVLERGQSNYNATEGDISGSGHTYNYGVSLFSKYSQFFDKDEAYVEGAIGYGHTSTLYRSDNLITGGGVNVQYKSKANYLNGQLAVGYVYNLDNYGFDSSVRYLYTHLNKDGVVIEGDSVNFNSADSSRIQLKEKVNFHYTNDITFSLAGIYEYEIDGKLDGSIDGVSAKSQSLQGSTGAMELGIKAIPTSDKNFSVDLLLTGYSGKRKGVSGTFVAKYDF